MPQVIVDPKDVRLFAAQLKEHVGELQNDMSKMNSQLKTLGETWRDETYHKFEEEFTTAVQILRRFTDASVKYAEFLGRKAEDAEKFLNQH